MTAREICDSHQLKKKRPERVEDLSGSVKTQPHLSHQVLRSIAMRCLFFKIFFANYISVSGSF